MAITQKIRIEEFTITEHEHRVVYIDDIKFDGSFSDAMKEVYNRIDAEKFRMEPWTGDDSKESE